MTTEDIKDALVKGLENNNLHYLIDTLAIMSKAGTLPKPTRALLLSAGHSTKYGEDRGAMGCNLIEGVENAKIRQRIYEIFNTTYKNATVFMDGDHSILKKSIQHFTALINKHKLKDALAFEIHFNAAGSPSASGTETVIPAQYTDFEHNTAKQISKGVSMILNTRLRGKKGVITEEMSRAKRLGWMRIPAQNVLLETCFITNETEVKAYTHNFETLCQIIACILYINLL